MARLNTCLQINATSPPLPYSWARQYSSSSASSCCGGTVSKVVFYSGSYVPLVEDSEIYFGPGPTEVLGWVLALLGVGALGVASGLSLRQLTRFKAWFLIAGLLLAAGGIAALVWDYNQVRTFGWFAYAPLSEAEFAPASMASVMGKLGLVAGTLLASSYLGFRYHSKPNGSAIRG